MFYEEFKDLNDLENLKHSSILKNSGNVKILDDIFEQNGDKWHIDTILINRMLLLKQGLKEDNIIDSGICSVCNKNVIHSYRAHGEKAGRATQIIAMI